MIRSLLSVNLLFLSSVLLCHPALGQDSAKQTVTGPGSSGIVTVKSRWYRHVSMMSMPVMSASQATATMGVPAASGPQSRNYGGSRRGFTYEATLRNESGREVKAIHWDHVFMDPRDGVEMRRFHFFDDWNSIGKGKTKTVMRMSGMPPSGVIDVEMLEKDKRPQYKERIEVRFVLYKGDVYWQAADATNAECGMVRRKLKVRATK